MPRKNDDERLAALVARRNRTDAEIRRLRAKNEKTARALDTRRKVIAGALALEHASRNRDSEFARIIVRLLDEYARPQDRVLFADLLPAPSPADDGKAVAGGAPVAGSGFGAFEPAPAAARSA